jgi:hypothetical protein
MYFLLPLLFSSILYQSAAADQVPLAEVVDDDADYNNTCQ